MSSTDVGRANRRTRPTQPSDPRHLPGWSGFTLAVGVLLLMVPMLSGCPGALDPDIAKMVSDGGLGSGNGGSTGTGGTSTGGSAGTGGSTLSCTANNDATSIVMGTCAQQYCHDAAGASASGGLDLTLDSGIASRLVGVQSTGSPGTNGSLCAGQVAEPYLVPGSNPASGLLIDKTKSNVQCGSRMPLIGNPLTAMQTNCLIQWATTLTSP